MEVRSCVVREARVWAYHPNLRLVVEASIHVLYDLFRRLPTPAYP